MTKKKYTPPKPRPVEGRRPDFKVWALIPGTSKTNEQRGVIGAAWDNGEEIVVKLNPFVVVDSQAVIRLYRVQPEDRLNGVEVTTQDDGDNIPY